MLEQMNDPAQHHLRLCNEQWMNAAKQLWEHTDGEFCPLD
jgi:hypothetical protein